MKASLLHAVLSPVRRVRNRAFHVGRRLARQLGYRCRATSAERLSVVVPSYARPRNIDLILSALVPCDFVSEIIVTNNNPAIPLDRFIRVRDPRIRVVHQPRRMPASVRFDLSRAAAERWILAIDDDVFPSSRQVEALFERLLAAPHAVHGYGGETWGDPPDGATYPSVDKVIHDLCPRSRPQETPGVSWVDNRRIQRRTTLSTACYRAVRRPRGTVPVDTLMWAFAYTRDHVETYFDMLARLGIENEKLTSSEDVPLSFAGRGPALIHGVGPLCRCPSDSEPGIATWMRPGFFEHRRELVARCRALQSARGDAVAWMRGPPA